MFSKYVTVKGQHPVEKAILRQKYLCIQICGNQEKRFQSIYSYLSNAFSTFVTLNSDGGGGGW